LKIWLASLEAGKTIGEVRTAIETYKRNLANPGSNPGLSTNNNQIINLMAKEVKKITGDWTKSISEMKLNEVVEFPISAYDGIMSTIRYRVRRRFGIIIKREGELDYKKGVFRAKRIS
jgi:hypothetical protein